MSCGCDKPKTPRTTCKTTPPVLELGREECPILFHTVELEGSSIDNPPYIGQYKNVLLVYKGDGARFLFSSDGIPTSLAGDGAGEVEYNNILNRPRYAGETITSSTNIPDVDEAVSVETAERTAADDALQDIITGVSDDLANEAYERAEEDRGIQGGLEAEATAREEADDTLDRKIDQEVATLSGGISALDTAINRDVVTDISIPATASTTSVELSETKTNLKTASSVTTTLPLPVASSTQAGVMNKATYDAVTSNTANINALLNGAVAVTGLSASPAQQDITDAWKQETGLTTLMNRAAVYDVSNDKVWTYYANDATWHAASNTAQVTINTFTNASEGVIKGSTTAGQVFAESDGTGSVNGWDTLTSTVADNTSKLATIAQGAEVNVQSNWSETNTSSDAYIRNKPTIPTVNNATLTIQKNGTSVATFTANASSNVTANITVPTLTVSTTDIGAGATLAANTLYGVYV